MGLMGFDARVLEDSAMRIREIHFDDVVAVPGHVQISGGISTARETAFHVDDGWDIREVLPGVFSLCHTNMSAPVTVGGYGYSFVPCEEATAPEAPQAKRKGKH